MVWVSSFSCNHNVSKQLSSIETKPITQCNVTCSDGMGAITAKLESVALDNADLIDTTIIP